MVLKFDKDYIDSHYLEIYEKIYTEPVIMPKLITKNTGRDIIHISYSLVFKFQDIKIPKDVMDVKNSERERIRRFEDKTLEDNTPEDAERIIREFHENELMEFLNVYPEYKGVILNESISSKVLGFIGR